MSPRPILKRSVSTADKQQRHHHTSSSHGVHFPPSPALTRTFTVHSSSTYDRSPIVVSPNTCALPERGCPGRTYELDEQVQPRQRGIRCARDYHPRALSFASRPAASSVPTTVPPLVPDLSSESEESDGFSCLPSDLIAAPTATFGVHGLAGGSKSLTIDVHGSNGIINGHGYIPCDEDPALAFLPYPSSPSPMSSSLSKAYTAATPNAMFYSHQQHLQQQPDSTDDDAHHALYKSRRKRTERRHESSRDPDRIPRSAHVSSDFGMGSLSISPRTSRSPTRKKGVRPQRVPVMPPTTEFGGFGVADDGCLGGF
ncbi:hypothetical protein D9613_003839 [Agrocybe pediades]|uniref:Uncharacterized protein n=1 Tax=Agrocybe pediades TaxID=84607 RepID=A0A8H4QHY5_9AGAR|nr:hypothetical protein D9613_003839 [Agrocybe pediades]